MFNLFLNHTSLHSQYVDLSKQLLKTNLKKIIHIILAQNGYYNKNLVFVFA
jgi:hypothetical protein